MIALVSGAMLASAAGAFEIKSLFKRKQLAAREISIDTGEAVRMLSAYRKTHGVGSLRLDPKLTRIAADHALKMAAANRLAHVVRGEGSFGRRLRDGGFDAAVASENIGGGYKTLAEAMDGWKRSREHNKNMLRPDVTLMGIARADAAGSKYGTYWALVLARPYERPPGPSSGPAGPSGLIFGR